MTTNKEKLLKLLDKAAHTYYKVEDIFDLMYVITLLFFPMIVIFIGDLIKTHIDTNLAGIVIGILLCIDMAVFLIVRKIKRTYDQVFDELGDLEQAIRNPEEEK